MPTGLAASTEMQVLETIMSAYIQKRDLQAGPAKLLAILNKRKDDPQLGDSTRFLQSTALRIKQQLDEYLKQGDAGKRITRPPGTVTDSFWSRSIKTPSCL